MKNIYLLRLAFALLVCFLAVSQAAAQDNKSRQNPDYPEWRTNTEKHSINLDDLDNPGVAKDGIPAIDHPRFVTIADARKWLGDREPVIVAGSRAPA